MWEVRPEPQFQRGYKRVMKAHPQLRQEFLAAVRELVATGRVPEAYHPHELAAPGETATDTLTSTYPTGLWT